MPAPVAPPMTAWVATAAAMTNRGGAAAPAVVTVAP